MMISKLLSFCSFFLLPLISHASAIKYEGYDIKLNEKDLSIVLINSGDQVRECKIINWEVQYNHGMGDISLTSDHKGVLVYLTNKYLNPDEIISCKNGEVELHEINDPSSPGDIIIDVNFKHKIYLSVSLEDAKSLSYTATVARFGSDKNLLSGPGFFDINDKPDPFYIGDNIYKGNISLDGNYVHPSTLDCSKESFPGVWDIKSNKKVIFPSTMSDEKIKNGCKKLFDGKETLEKLGGKLITPEEYN